MEWINFGLSIVFIVEMVMKVVAYGPKKYASDQYNVFDAFIVTTTIIEYGEDAIYIILCLVYYVCYYT